MADASAGITYLQLVTQRSNIKELPPIQILAALPEYGMPPKYSMDEGEALARQKTAGSRRSIQVGARVKAFFKRDSSLDLPRKGKSGSFHSSYPTSVISDEGNGRKSRDERGIGKKGSDEAVIVEEEVNYVSGDREVNKIVSSSTTDLSKIPIPDDNHETNNFKALGLSTPRPPTPPRSKQQPILSPQKFRDLDQQYQRQSEDQHSLPPPREDPPPVPHLDRQVLSAPGSPVFGPKSPRRSLSRASSYRPFSLQIDRSRQAQGQAEDRPSFDFDSSTLTDNPKPSPPRSPPIRDSELSSLTSVTNSLSPNNNNSNPPSRNPSPPSINTSKPPSRISTPLSINTPRSSTSRFTNLNLSSIFNPPPRRDSPPPPVHDDTNCPFTDARASNSALKSCLESNIASQSNLKSKLTSSLARIETLSTRLATAQRETQAANKRSDQLTSQLSRLNTENSNLRVELATWHKKHEDVELLLMKEGARSKSLKVSLEERDYEMEGYRLRVEVLEGKVRSLKGERDLIRRENEGLWGLLDCGGGNGAGDGQGHGQGGNGNGNGNGSVRRNRFVRGSVSGYGRGHGIGMRDESDSGSGSGSGSGSKYQDRYELERGRGREREHGHGHEHRHWQENEYGQREKQEYAHEHLRLDKNKSQDAYELEHGYGQGWSAQRAGDEYGNGREHLRLDRDGSGNQNQYQGEYPHGHGGGHLIPDRYENQDEYDCEPLRLGRAHGGHGGHSDRNDDVGHRSGSVSPINGLFAGNGNRTESETGTRNTPMSFEEMIRGLKAAGSSDDDDGGGLLRLGPREERGSEHESDMDGKYLRREDEESFYPDQDEEGRKQEVGERVPELSKRN